VPPDVPSNAELLRQPSEEEEESQRRGASRARSFPPLPNFLFKKLERSAQ